MKFAGIILAAALFAAQPVWALTAPELKEMLDTNQDVTVIDIRPNVLYRQGHIQGAINIPASVLAKKRLPKFNLAVVCGDGIRTDLAQKAADILNRDKGISARILDGGYAAWDCSGRTTTASKGIKKSHMPMVSYSDLIEMAGSGTDMVLVDLRTPSTDMTDLSQTFPGVRVIPMPDKTQIFAQDPDQLYILIGDGTGKAGETAVKMNEAGFNRVAVLAGGEVSLSRKGAPGYEILTTTGTVEKKE